MFKSLEINDADPNGNKYPGQNGMGETSAGFLEMSNVETVDELVSMISAQRAYELNSKTITMADEMLQTVNRLKR